MTELPLYRFSVIQQESSEFQCPVYGIVQEEHTGSGWQEVGRIPNVSPDRRLVEDLAERFTREQLSPLHLLDAVMDAITEALI